MKLKTVFILGLFLAVVLAGSGFVSAASPQEDEVGTKAFKSEKEMKDYLEEMSQNSIYRRTPENVVIGYATLTSYGPQPSNMSVDRYSQTNVQVQGVDEADIVKTDGNFIYYSSGLVYLENITFHDNTKNPTLSHYSVDKIQKIFVIDAFPPETADVISDIYDENGLLYLENDTLIIINQTNQIIAAFDIKNPSAPKKMWEQEFEGNYVDSRLIDGQLCLLTRGSKLSYPVAYMGKTIPYYDCYYPYGPNVLRTNINVTHFISSVDIETGNFDKTIVLIGAAGTILYASENNFYLTNYYAPNTQKIELDFIQMYGNEYFSKDLMNEINKIMGYDLNDYIKYMAVKDQIYVYDSLLDNKDPLKININRYYSDYNTSSELLSDEYERTSITKIDLKTFDVESGFVRGRIDNRYLLDEENDYLRVVAASGRNRRGSPTQIETDVYVFDSKMDVAGKLTGLAPREDIKSFRYAGNILYLVTYERIERVDPFFVIDLSTPENPTVLGELKMPGFSTYLHPLNETHVIGVGYTDNGGDSKIALFDVSDVNQPIELDTYIFGTEEYVSRFDFISFFLTHPDIMKHTYIEAKDNKILLSDLLSFLWDNPEIINYIEVKDSKISLAQTEKYVSLSNPHSFLWDPDKNIMVIPSYEHAYIFEVKDSKITLIKDDYHKNSPVHRSLYINDYLYIISNSEIHIYDQNTWQLVNTITIPQPIDLDYKVYPPPASIPYKVVVE